MWLGRGCTASSARGPLVEPERWGQVKQIVNACLEMEPGRRKEHIKTACIGDPTLIAEVESLLNSYDEVGDFLETSALGRHPESLTGRRIGSYQISGLI